ncbi:hypothetical protein BO70DRAFT_393172 [Aspergillus heteromorphus CBS 117.55]|uniref:Uncharacterized protein n=1 Tax=Aspergillus heteromorphus CBS 117.55 TaxID=1448321 RepID=A0A317WU81_9EURO|nr:uncharacterized protein BO70DRAFT_393172 [Aspergillus heteromorphus CBS 117.55]PWY89983.1 hypothetical protein BO70DRAFT_393172 [Aspergillus heteromorphus CBS 117.55]
MALRKNWVLLSFKDNVVYGFNSSRGSSSSSSISNNRAWHIRKHMVYREYQDDSNRSFYWLERQSSCADKGGCCGRGCRSEDSEDSSKNLLRFMVIARLNVLAASKFRGRYTPHAKLPKPLSSRDY